MYITCRLTVFFENPFWVGVYERTSDEGLEVSRIVFGAEPKDYEVYNYFLENWSRLRFSPAVEAKTGFERIMNPKRMQRAISSQLSDLCVGTKSQQALKLLQEQNALERKFFVRQKTEEEKQRKFSLKQQKKKEKHRGR